MYKNFRVGGGIVLGLSALVLSLAACTAAIDRNSDNSVKRGAADFAVGSVNYKLCTSVDDINTTDTYIFSATYNNKEYFATTHTTKLFNVVARDKTSSLANLSSFNFEDGSSASQYKIKLNDGNYLGYKSSSDLQFNISASSKSFEWTISYSSNLFKIANVNTSSRYVGYNYNNGNARLAAYTDSTKFPYLNIYKCVAEQKAYTVTFETNGGSSVASQSVDTSSEIDLVAATTTKKYSNFKGWYLDAELTIPFDKETYDIISDITLYAKWATTWKVNFYNEGSIFNTTIVEENTTVTAPAKNPTKAADDIYEYTFSHWSLTEDGEAFDFKTLIKEVTNLYAVYTKTFQDISGTVATLEANSDITFSYKYDEGDFVEINDKIPNKLTTSTNTTLENGTFEYTSSGTYDGAYGTKLGDTDDNIVYTFNEAVNNAKLNFGVKCNGASFSGILEVSCLDNSGAEIKNAKQEITFTSENSNKELPTLSVDFNGISNIKSIKLNYTKKTGNLGIGEINITASRGSKNYYSFSNVKLNLGYAFNLVEDPRVVSTGLLVTAKDGFALTSNKSESLPTESYVAVFENTTKAKDYYIAVRFTNEEVKANYSRKIYVIPYVKTATEYVYGTTYSTSIEEEIAKIPEAGIRDLFSTYVA